MMRSRRLICRRNPTSGRCKPKIGRALISLGFSFGDLSLELCEHQRQTFIGDWIKGLTDQTLNLFDLAPKFFDIV
jgi:hypothetical protein